MSAVLQLSNKRMTVRVETDAANNIRAAAPVVRKFVGQPLDNLVQWMNRMGKTRIVLLRGDEREGGCFV